MSDSVVGEEPSKTVPTIRPDQPSRLPATLAANHPGRPCRPPFPVIRTGFPGGGIPLFVSSYSSQLSYRAPFVEACLAGLDDERAASWFAGLDEVVDAAVAPGAEAADRTEAYPVAALTALREFGALGVQVPTRYGGLGFGDRAAALVVERVARACAATAAVLMFHYQVVRRTIGHGAEARRHEDLAAFAGAGVIGASAWTEPGSGRGKKHVATRITAGDGGWTLTGDKTFCTGLPGAGVVHVLADARLPEGEGTSFVRVDMKGAGVRVPACYPLMGLRGSGTGTLELRGVEVTADDLVGGVGAGGRLMAENHQVCLNPGLLALGTASAAFDSALPMCTGAAPGTADRTGSDRIRALLARALVRLESAYLYGAYAIGRQGGAGAHVTTGKFKLAATEAAEAVTGGLLDAVGSRGFVASFPLERHFRDAHATSLMGPAGDLINDRVIDHLLEN